MEELQSTEILDREILEDARKKASRVLKTREEEIRARNVNWEKKLSSAVEELDKKYGNQKEQAEKNIMARLPIDKLRLKIENIEGILNSAVQSWYESLPRGRVLELLSKELKARLARCKDQIQEESEITVQIEGLNQKEAEVVLRSAGENISFNIQVVPLAASKASFPSIILDTGDIRVTASIGKTIDFLLHEKREELAVSLVGRNFIGDI